MPMREQSGFYEKPAQAQGTRRRPRNLVNPSSPQKRKVVTNKGKMSKQEAKTRGQVRQP